jgi:hypothetical protein
MFQINNKAAFLTSCLIFLLSFYGFAQTEKKIAASLAGSVMLSTDGKSVFYNMGGPSVKLTYKKWSGSVNMFPSLRFFDVKGTINVNPILGAGITIGYKRWMIGFPCYYLADKKIWVLTAGAGVRLGK